MNHFDRLETFAQRLIEGVFSRVFQPQQKPISRPPKKRVETNESLPTVTHRAKQWLLQVGDRQRSLGEPVVRIGRALDNDIILADKSVSRYHAELRWRNGGYHLCPPARADKANNGEAKDTLRLAPHTAVNDEATTQHLLEPGDVIALGETRLTVIVSQTQR